MDFSHSEEFDEIRRTVREFAENEIRPHMMEWDEAQTFPQASSTVNPPENESIAVCSFD